MINRRLLGILLQKRSLLLALAGTVALSLASTVCLILQARILSVLIGRAFLEREGLEPLLSLFLALIGILLARSGLAWGREVCADALTSRVKISLRREIQDHLLTQGPLAVGAEQTGELVNTLCEGVEALDLYFREYLPQLGAAVLAPLTILFFIFPVDWISALVLLVTAPLIPFFMVLIGSAADAAAKKQWKTTSRMSAYILDVIQGLSTLKMLGRSEALEAKIAAVSERHRQGTMAVLRVAFLSALTLELLGTISTAVVAVGIGLRLLAGKMVFQDALFVLFLAPDFYAPLRLLGTRFHAAISGTSAAERIFAILDKPPFEEKRVGNHSDEGWSEITFKDVGARYGQEGIPALNGVSFTLQRGKRTALVGPSGAGKTTLAALLLRFVRPAAGEIRVGETSLEDISETAWRRQIAWVPQRPHIFFDTVLENIRLSRPDASREEVVWAARQAYAHEFIEALPQGYDTFIGECGARLSGGQAQRLALARAFLKKEAQLLILDEAVSQLDPPLAEQTQVAAERLTNLKAVLIIAHRLGSVRRADEILVLADGKIVQRGDHAALSAVNGLYRDMLTGAVTDSATPIGQDGRIDLGEPFPGAAEIGAPTSPAEEKEQFRPELQGVRLFTAVGLSILCGFSTLASGIGLMATSAYVISAAALRPSIADIQVAIVGVRFFGLARGVFRYLERYVSHEATFQILTRLRVWIYRVLQPLAPARLSTYHSGDILSRLVVDIQSLESFYLRALYPPLVAVITGLGVTLILGRFDSRLAGTAAGLFILAGIGLPGLVWLLSRRAAADLVTERMELQTACVDFLQGMADLLAGAGPERVAARCQEHSRALCAAQSRLAQVTGIQNALSILLLGGAVLGALATAVPLVESGALNGVYLAVIVMILWAGFECVQPLPLAAQALESNRKAFGRLGELVQAVPEVKDAPVPVGIPFSTTGSFGIRGFSVRGLTFTYPGQDRPALSDVSFELPHGKWLAVVGASGAGKSTLLSLFLRFWEYQEGEILIDGLDIRRLAQAEVRRKLATSAQRVDLFNASIRDNLRLGNPGADEGQIIAVALAACAHEFIQTLPYGYNTWIGEGGSRLSGGERQRISLGRAFLMDAPLLLLDEPTAGLDSLTERRVLEGIYSQANGKALLMITHRLVGLERMDEILVMDDGRIVERGTQAQLIARNGRYACMLAIQNDFILQSLQNEVIQ